MEELSWIQRLSKNIKDSAGEEIMNTVIAGYDDLASPEEKSEWAKKAMERLDKLIPDDQTRWEIMAKSACRFPIERLAYVKAVYDKTKSIDEVLKAMHTDKDQFFAKPYRKGNIVYSAKKACDSNKYQQANTQREKQLSYCHCPIVRETKGKISLTFCYCGSGWYKQIWEGILEKPIRVETLKSILQGDDVCEFAIHI